MLRKLGLVIVHQETRDMTTGFRVVIVVLAGLLAFPLVESTHPAEARQRSGFTKVTRTFSNPNRIAIPESGTFGVADPYPSRIRVKGLDEAKIRDVNLILRGYTHSVPFSTAVLLEAPNGRRATVMDEVGGEDAVANIKLKLDDEAAAKLPESGPLSSGSFRPNDAFGCQDFPPPAPACSGDVALSTFDDGSPHGTWKLYIWDGYPDDTGSLEEGWSLQIKAKVRNR
jgi:hypothetical protein